MHKQRVREVSPHAVIGSPNVFKCNDVCKYCVSHDLELTRGNRVGSNLCVWDGQCCNGAPDPAACDDINGIVKCNFSDNDHNLHRCDNSSRCAEALQDSDTLQSNCGNVPFSVVMPRLLDFAEFSCNNTKNMHSNENGFHCSAVSPKCMYIPKSVHSRVGFA